MQQALYPGASVTEAACGPVSSRRRANKFMLAGAAVVTAGALVSGPAAQSLPVEIQNRAVQLTGLSAKVTDSPFAVYSEIVTDTLTNVGALGGAWLAHPFPILTQVATNQIGYASEFFGAVLAAPANWQAYSDGRGATFAQQFATAIAAGDIGGAVQYGSSYLLYGALATISRTSRRFCGWRSSSRSPVPPPRRRRSTSGASPVRASRTRCSTWPPCSPSERSPTRWGGSRWWR